MNPESNTATHIFSTIRFFRRIEERIASINKYPITPANLVIQQDAYQRLGAISFELESNDDEDYDEDDYEVFATLECSRKEKDENLRFAMEFSLEGVVLVIEGTGIFHIDYSYFEDENDAVDQIMAALVMLSNGQISSLLTTWKGKVCASESLLYQPDNRVPKVIRTEALYPKRLSSDDLNNYDFEILKNSYLKDKIQIPRNFFLDTVSDDSEPYAGGRIFNSAALSPLTKKAYMDFTDLAFKRDIGQRPNESIWQYFYRSWEFWVIVLLVIGTLYGALASAMLPSFFVEYPVLLMPIVSFVSVFASLIVLDVKNSLKTRKEGLPKVWAILDKPFNKNVDAQPQEGIHITEHNEHVAPKAKNISPKQSKYTSWLTTILSYIAPILLAISGVIFANGIPASSLNVLKPETVGGLIVLTAGLQFLMAIRLQYLIGESIWYLRTATISIVMVCLPIGLALKENAPDGPEFAWLLLVLGLSLPLLTYFIQKQYRK